MTDLAALYFAYPHKLRTKEWGLKSIPISAYDKLKLRALALQELGEKGVKDCDADHNSDLAHCIHMKRSPATLEGIKVYFAANCRMNSNKGILINSVLVYITLTTSYQPMYKFLIMHILHISLELDNYCSQLKNLLGSSVNILDFAQSAKVIFLFLPITNAPNSLSVILSIS
jgi:hypothetical protein